MTARDQDQAHAQLDRACALTAVWFRSHTGLPDVWSLAPRPGERRRMQTMKRRSFASALVLALLAGVMVVPATSAAGRPAYLVSNERTRFGSTSLQGAIDAAASGDTLIVKGTCAGTGVTPGFGNANFARRPGNTPF